MLKLGCNAFLGDEQTVVETAEIRNSELLRSCATLQNCMAERILLEVASYMGRITQKLDELIGNQVGVAATGHSRYFDGFAAPTSPAH